MMSKAEKRITLFADSLALPRGVDWGDTPFEDTYPYLLEKDLRDLEGFKNHIFINRSQRFRTITKTLQEIEDFAILPKSDIIIVHCGIVDCAPRVFSESQREWLGNLPDIARKSVLKFIKICRSALIQYVIPNKTYVTTDHFRSALHDIKSKTTDKKIIFINIIEPSNSIEYRSPGFQENARQYNKIIQESANTSHAHLIDLNAYVRMHGGPDALTVDGMHISKKAHDYLAKQIREFICT